MAMFGVLLLASVSAVASFPAAQVLIAFDTRAIDPEPDKQAEVEASKPVAAAIQAGGAPAVRPAPPPPAPVKVPVMALELAPRTLPVEMIAVPLVSVSEEVADVSRVIGSGEEEDGGSGNGGAGAGGNGGAGVGGGATAGGGRKLFASWAPSMDFSRDARYYPLAARAAQVEGIAWMRCFVIRNDRVRDCTLVGEEPRGFGFGEAALRTVPGIRLRLHDERGKRVYDDWAIVTSTFTLDSLREPRQAQREVETGEPDPVP